MTKKWIWSNHIKRRLVKRGIPEELVDTALNKPDNVMSEKDGRTVYQKIAGSKLIRVVTEGDTLVTVYLTSKIRKYMKEMKS